MFNILFLCKDSERVVTKEEGLALAEELGCLFFECSAKTRENVDRCFEELAQKVWKQSDAERLELQFFICFALVFDLL